MMFLIILKVWIQDSVETFWEGAKIRKGRGKQKNQQISKSLLNLPKNNK